MSHAASGTPMYRHFLSPLSQIEIASHFVAQMESRVSEEWPDEADYDEDSSREFLDEVEDEGFCDEILRILKALKLRFEFDGQEEGEG